MVQKTKPPRKQKTLTVTKNQRRVKLASWTLQLPIISLCTAVNPKGKLSNTDLLSYLGADIVTGNTYTEIVPYRKSYVMKTSQGLTSNSQLKRQPRQTISNTNCLLDLTPPNQKANPCRNSIHHQELPGKLTTNVPR